MSRSSSPGCLPATGGGVIAAQIEARRRSSSSGSAPRCTRTVRARRDRLRNRPHRTEDDMASMAARYRRWFAYEEDAHAKVLASLRAAAPEARSQPGFGAAVDLM